MTGKDIKFLSVMNGDPFGYKTWSGSSYYFFNALKRNDLLCQAISAEPSKAVKLLHEIINFHPDLKKWKFKFHISVDYYKELTKAALEKIKEIPDNSYNVILQVGAWYDLTRIKDKVTVSYHDGNLQTLLSSPYGYPWVSDNYIKKTLMYEKELYAKIDRIFTMSKWLAESFVRDFGVSPDKVVPVGAGVNLPYTKEVVERNYDENKILFVGIAFERKGGKYLLEAFSRVKKEVKNAKLTIVGPKLEGLPEGVKCLDFVSKFTKEGIDTLLNEYASSSLFVMPSLYEPFGIVFLEAMAHRLPCIGTNVCAMPEIIDHGINGFVVPPRDSKALADSIIELLKNREKCKEMGDNAYKKYIQNYTWDEVAKKMVQCIP